MIKKYRLPITGTVKEVKKVKGKRIIRGERTDPICVIPILEESNYGGWSYTCSDPDLETETMEITLNADEKVHQLLENEIKSVPKLHDLIAKHGFKPLKRLDK